MIGRAAARVLRQAQHERVFCRILLRSPLMLSLSKHARNAGASA
jgi:hypothetical protein